MARVTCPAMELIPGSWLAPARIGDTPVRVTDVARIDNRCNAFGDFGYPAEDYPSVIVLALDGAGDHPYGPAERVTVLLDD